jgi:hypothetical protein
MADPMVVNKALKAFANNYNKSDQWVEDTQKLWARGLADVQDRDLVRGVEEWCRKRNRLPNLNRLRELIDANPRTSKPAILDGCPACDRTGWRELCRWYEKQGKTHVRCVVAACDCMKGQRLVSSSVPHWETLASSWKADPFTDAVHIGTAKKPHLTTEQRHTPEQLEQMKERLKSNQPSVSGWSTLAQSRK